MIRSLGRMVGLLLNLYVFDQVITNINATVAASTYFGDAVTFIYSLFSVMGILGAFEIIYSALRSTGMI